MSTDISVFMIAVKMTGEANQFVTFGDRPTQTDRMQGRLGVGIGESDAFRAGQKTANGLRQIHDLRRIKCAA